jgi:uncharacterized membrane protein YbhN (UPF0104 family)
MHSLPRLDRRAIAGALVVFAVLAAIVAVPGLIRDDVGDAFGTIADANPLALWLAALCFAGLIATMGLAWRAGVHALGGEVGPVNAGARFVVGSLTAALVPAGAGGAVRIALFSRVLPPPDRVWRAGGISAAVTAARSLALAVLVLVAWLCGALPLWPVALFLGGVALAVVVALVVREREPHSHVAHIFDVFGALSREPACAVKLVLWTSAALACRTAAAVVVAATMGLPEPLLTGLVAIAALSVAGMVQLTPANLGVGGGALALALAARGISVDDALSVGIAFQAIETITSLLLGGAGVLVLARGRLAAWPLRLAGAGGGVALLGAFGMTVWL